ncbi:hypothetical protein [Geodermatophilus maliterrae]|uniref:tRNA-dihydrouridine synthase n=1 Tax=Geodermatophilus maliterrae TaxID=3162531 RepID=A0ABV3XC09_9ACTN
MAFSNRVRGALTTTVLATAATGFLAGCGADEEDDEQVAYCTDEDGEIVDDDYCDDDYRGGGGLFFLYLGAFRPGLPVGTVLPSGGTRINPTDTAARQRYGLPGTGKVTGGQRVTGGIGSGSGGTSSGS